MTNHKITYDTVM